MITYFFCEDGLIWSYLKFNLNLCNSARYFGQKLSTSSVALGYTYITSFPAHLFAVRGKQNRGSGTLQTQD